MSRPRPPSPYHLIRASEHLRILIGWTLVWVVVWGLVSLVR